MKLKSMLTMVAAVSAIGAVAFTVTAQAAWSEGTGANQGKWWYDQGNGSYAHGGWQVIDSDGDGTGEYYYFDADGWLLTNTTTPDGYQVNGNGAWVENGAVKTQAVQATQATQNAQTAALSEADFVVSGNNSVTRGTADHNIITMWRDKGWLSGFPWHSFSKGDSAVTARGISFESTKSDVLTKYGDATVFNFDQKKDWGYWTLVGEQPQSSEAQTMVQSKSYVEYVNQELLMRFYFDSSDHVIFILYYRNENNKTATQVQVDASHKTFSNEGTLSEAEYWYSDTTLYVWNEATQKFDQQGKAKRKNTVDGVLQERQKIGFVSDFMLCAPITNLDANSFEVVWESDPLFCIKSGNAWYFDDNGDGVLSDQEKSSDVYVVVEDDESISWIELYAISDTDPYLPAGKTIISKITYKNTLPAFE